MKPQRLLFSSETQPQKSVGGNSTVWPQLSQRQMKQSSHSSKLTAFSVFPPATKDAGATALSARRGFVGALAVVHTPPRPDADRIAVAPGARQSANMERVLALLRVHAAPWRSSSKSRTSNQVAQIGANASLTCAGNRINCR